MYVAALGLYPHPHAHEPEMTRYACYILITLKAYIWAYHGCENVEHVAEFFRILYVDIILHSAFFSNTD